MRLLKLEDLCLRIISLNLSIFYKYLIKNGKKLPTCLGQKLYNYSLSNHQSFIEQDLKLFENSISPLNSIILLGKKFKLVKYFNFLNRHQLDYFKIVNLYNSLIENNSFKFSTKILEIKYFINEKFMDNNFLFYCSALNTIIIDASFNSQGIQLYLPILIKNSGENLENLQINGIQFKQDIYINFLGSLKNKIRLKRISFRSLVECNRIDDKNYQCQTYMLLNHLNSSSNTLKYFEFGGNFCLQHSQLFLKNFKKLEFISIYVSNISIKYHNEFFNYLAINLANNLKNFQLIINNLDNSFESLCFFLERCENLEKIRITCLFLEKIIYPEKIFVSLMNSANPLKDIILFPVKNPGKKFFVKLENLLKICHSIQTIKIDNLPEDKCVNFLKEIKNSMNFLSSVQFFLDKSNSKNLLYIGKFLKYCENIKSFCLQCKIPEKN